MSSSEKFYHLLEKEGFVENIWNVIGVIKEQDERGDPTDLTGAIELVFLHSENFELYFTDLGFNETQEFKLFVGELIISDYLGARWYP